jgi:biopolymer transport protein ExbD
MRLPDRPRHEHAIFSGSAADVAFLVLIVSMLGSAFTASRGIDLALPDEPDPRVEIGWNDAVDLRVAWDGSLWVDGEPVLPDRLLERLGERLAASPGTPVILRTDAEAPYGAMVAVLDELRMAPEKAGFEVEDLVIPTIREQQNWGPVGWQED